MGLSLHLYAMWPSVALTLRALIARLRSLYHPCRTSGRHRLIQQLFRSRLLRRHQLEFHGRRLCRQEVERVFVEAVLTGADGMKSVNYPALVGPADRGYEALKAADDNRL